MTARRARQSVEGIGAWLEHRLPEVIPEVLDLAATVDPDWLAVLAQAHAQAGRRTEALAVVDRLLATPRGGVREPVRTVLLADAVHETGSRAHAERLLPALEAYGDTVVVLWVGTTVLGPAALYRGALKRLLGRPDAPGELESALSLAERAGMTPFAARASDLHARPAGR